MAIIGFLYLRLRWLFVLWLLLTISAVALDGLSISLLLPLVSEQDSAIGRFVYRLFAAVGIEYTLVSAVVFIACAYFARNLLFTCRDWLPGGASPNCRRTPSSRWWKTSAGWATSPSAGPTPVSSTMP